MNVVIRWHNPATRDFMYVDFEYLPSEHGTFRSFLARRVAWRKHYSGDRWRYAGYAKNASAFDYQCEGKEWNGTMRKVGK